MFIIAIRICLSEEAFCKPSLFIYITLQALCYIALPYITLQALYYIASSMFIGGGLRRQVGILRETEVARLVVVTVL